MFAAPTSAPRAKPATLLHRADPSAARSVAAPVRRGAGPGGAPFWDFAKLAIDASQAVPASAPARSRLTIGLANDPAEHAADALAERVLGGGAPLPISFGGAPVVRRKCAECAAQKPLAEDEPPNALRRQAQNDAVGGAAAPAQVDDVLATPGVPLDHDARAFFEPRFGRSFADVRIHTDADAARSAAAVDALAYSVGSHVVLGTSGADISFAAQRRLLAHELAHVAQQSHPVLRRQPKPHTIGGPLDLKPDICITLPDPIGQRCGQEAADLCKKFDPIPAVCSPICAIFDCSKPAEPKTLCPPKWRAATSKEFAGQCCQGGIDSAERCCTPDRIAWAEDRCCAKDEVVVDNHCKKTSDLPPIDPGMLCPPDRRTTAGLCCTPPMVPQGAVCMLPPQPGTTPDRPDQPLPQLGILWTDEIHFRQDHPAVGETSAAAVLTPEGQRELEGVLSWLELSPDLQVRLIGHASSEGTDDYNQALAARRAEFVLAALAGRGLADRVADPLFDDGAETGCQKLGAGRWSCGETQADQSAARPQDRVVRVTFARNSLPPLRSEPLKAPRPLRF